MTTPGEEEVQGLAQLAERLYGTPMTVPEVVRVLRDRGWDVTAENVLAMLRERGVSSASRRYPCHVAQIVQRRASALEVAG